MGRIDSIDDFLSKGTHTKEVYRDPGWGRGPCTKGYTLTSLDRFRWNIDFWEEDGNYAGGITFSSGPVQSHMAYMIYLGILEYTKIK